MRKVGFACTTIFHYIHYKHIANELESRGYVVEYIIFTPKLSDRYNRIFCYFKEHSIKFSDFEDIFLAEQFDVILAPYYLAGFQLLDKNILKVRLMYGYAKDSWNYAEWNKGFDLVLAYGPYASKKLNQFTEVKNIGHPRFKDKYKENVVDISGKIFTREGDKPILLYCPTWSDLSSLEKFMEKKEIFLEDFTLLIKLHHGNSSSDLFNLSKAQNIYYFNETTDLFDLLYLCDVILSDYSGSIFDAMLLRKPIVLLDSYDKDIKDSGYLNISEMKNVAVYSQSHRDENNTSLDIKVRGVLPHARKISDVIELIKNYSSGKDLPYEGLVKELYSYQDNNAPIRAANAIDELIENKKNYRKYGDDSFYLLNTIKINCFLNANNDQQIAIWGAGEMGQILYAWLKKQWKIDCFFDMDVTKQGKKINGISVKKIDLSKKILITVAKYEIEIKDYLIKEGKREGIDFISVFNRGEC
ncbi:CDP-glycerol--poly(glycerophosphate) glycerophosphotransferase [Evansella cellulosilytica]|uniref:CDP-glycerol:poly(Glycerophosphate) glycerophosphotransferase n=1 Tax=Evansella cellulosilytica (strain ATCC 21833 / DSM 2522 / FERM P-1141 / JCM 9156 / N-4) TaxID=649639 RepID=E6TS83_EVAC2|nr:CDP-glycerol--poly(glycerophosphate) glycerophosphotransferase [Evansella cellulosilytica]ADU31852.1 CDP-glycerol:poly(glycerophosphate) glycerophosphotransferase [Evansella cellulosilytica DSM 2522]